VTDSCEQIIGGIHAKPIPGQTYSVALLEKKNLSKSADTTDAHAKKIADTVNDVRSMATMLGFQKDEQSSIRREVSTTST
jgi:hypothetical protein